MHCRNCGSGVDEKAIACPKCGVPPLGERKFCQNCGVATDPSQVMCVKCGVSLAARSTSRDRVVAGVLGIFLGSLGIHKFYLGYNKPALVMLLVSVLAGVVTFGIASAVMATIGLVEGIIYLTKSGEEFAATYVQRARHWF